MLFLDLLVFVGGVVAIAYAPVVFLILWAKRP